MILLRARTLAAGLSGVRVELVEALLGLLTAGIVPWVPEHGSSVLPETLRLLPR